MSDESGPVTQVVCNFDDSVIKYNPGSGQETHGKFVTLFAPALNHYQYVAKLKQMFIRATPEPTEEQVKAAAEERARLQSTGEKAPEISPQMIINMIAASEVDLFEFWEECKKLFLQPGIVKIEGTTQIIPDHFDYIGIKDAEKMVGMYMANFILA